jgi:hypothetical protein
MTQDKINELVGFINGMGDGKVKFIRCDNAGENTKAEAVLTKATWYTTTEWKI